MSEQPEMDDVIEELFARQPESDMVPTLDRVRRVMDLLGDPQTTMTIIHVTGTNGKTSTARMIETMIRRAGLRTGLFTSPHLLSVTERIVVDGEPIADGAFVAAYEDLRPLLDIVDAQEEEEERTRLTFFEVLTALAYAVFADAPVDVAVVEVGLGGTWDATNVGDGRIAVVTPIDVDHTAWLGGTPAVIAREKAGIIKPGAIAVIGDQPTEVLEVLLARCVDVGADAVVSGRDFALAERKVAVGGQVLTIRGIGGVYEDVFLALMGEHQAANAALAVAAVESLLVDATALDMAVVDALGSVISRGRLEAVSREPTVLVDAAHNPAGARALAAALTDSYAFERVVAVLGVMADKDVSGIVAALSEVVDVFVTTRNSSPRAAAADWLGSVAADVVGEQRVQVVPDVAEAIAAAEELAGVGGCVLVTGSVVTAADTLALRGARG